MVDTTRQYCLSFELHVSITTCLPRSLPVFSYQKKTLDQKQEHCLSGFYRCVPQAIRTFFPHPATVLLQLGKTGEPGNRQTVLKEML
ncbi:hypothetical protein ANANG_G00106900 [Anguilla anguilla]|uniref:Uncharacterized protein n=1 Tax=Anguilla anguilla TaxID=7936 RepID=A0A9D3S1M4_ANGAN|nr:hypothetical protein ANANG_G00106900 [Anguilla anguilla]